MEVEDENEIQLFMGMGPSAYLVDSIPPLDCSYHSGNCLGYLKSGLLLPNRVRPAYDLKSILQTFAARSTPENAPFLQESTKCKYSKMLRNRAFVRMTNDYMGKQWCSTYKRDVRELRTRQNLLNDELWVFLKNETYLEEIHVQPNMVWDGTDKYSIASISMIMEPSKDIHALMMVINHVDQAFYVLDPNGVSESISLTVAFHKLDVMKHIGFPDYAPVIGYQRDVVYLGGLTPQADLGDTMVGFQEGICQPLSTFLAFLAIVTDSFTPFKIADELVNHMPRKLVHEAMNGFYQTLSLYQTSSAYAFGSLIQAPSALKGGRRSNK